MSTIDQAKIGESSRAKDRRPEPLSQAAYQKVTNKLIN